MADIKQDPAKFQIYRAADARPLEETDHMRMVDFTPTQLEGLMAMYKPELSRGDETKVLFCIPGFSLIHAWFKKNFPLPLHSHDADCLYFIVSGTLKLGTELLGARDGFFVPANVPYTYTPGPNGVEILEFRHATHFDFNVKAKSEAYWKRAVDIVVANSDDWVTARRPVLNAD